MIDRSGTTEPVTFSQQNKENATNAGEQIRGVEPKELVHAFFADTFEATFILRLENIFKVPPLVVSKK